MSPWALQDSVSDSTSVKQKPGSHSAHSSSVRQLWSAAPSSWRTSHRRWPVSVSGGGFSPLGAGSNQPMASGHGVLD